MEEVAEFAGLNRRKRINFTAVAWTRIFEEYIPYRPAELDYKAFVNLVLALENPTTEASIKYFWKILDFDRSGYLSPMKIKYFYSAVHDSLVGNYDAPSAAHVVIEVFDLLACNDPRGASLSDMLGSKQGHVVVTMLLDVNGFWRYDNRESLVGGDDEEENPADNYSSAGSSGSYSNAPQLGAHSATQASLQVDAVDTLDALLDIESTPVSHSARPVSGKFTAIGKSTTSEAETMSEDATYRASHEINIHLPGEHPLHIPDSVYGKITTDAALSRRLVSQIDEEYEESKYTDASFEDFEDED